MFNGANGRYDDLLHMLMRTSLKKRNVNMNTLEDRKGESSLVYASFLTHYYTFEKEDVEYQIVDGNNRMH